MLIICPLLLLFLASDGCLQYFTGVSGQMFSFNYNDATVRPIKMLSILEMHFMSTLQGLQLSNTDYTVCVRMERNFCGIQYTACPDTGVWIAFVFVFLGSNTLHCLSWHRCSVLLDDAWWFSGSYFIYYLFVLVTPNGYTHHYSDSCIHSWSP